MRFLLNLALLLLFSTASAQSSKIAERTKNMQYRPGFVNYYWDAATGKIWLLIDRFDREFLYLNTLPAGLGSNDIGLDRGQIGSTRVVFFQKIGKKILLTQPNYEYRALSSDPLEQRAVRESFAQSVLWSFTVEEEENGACLVDATAFFVRDAHNAAERIKNAKQGTYTFNESRSAIYLPNTRNFPQNSEFEAIVSFTGTEAGRFVQRVTPTPEAITLRMHQAFVQLPDNDYRPRAYDVRSGYYTISYFDYSTPFSDPIEKLYICRHRLRKKDPSARLSDPVKPIVYYLDNGTPEPIRSALLDGARWWNQAFEAAGYRNAFRVEVLPDSADPMDIRYNMINWVHRSTRGWSYGATVKDPRTGEIIKGQVTLGSLRVRQDYLIFTGLLAPFETGKPVPETMRAAALQRLRQLSAHEVGHTLGLMHNYASSVNDRASVMDYPHPNITLNDQGDIDFSKVYTNEIGAWDKRAILFGYADYPVGEDEPAAGRKVLDETSAQGLLFISDTDARAADGMHPQAHLWDNGKDAMAELQNTLRVRRKALDRFSENVVPLNTPMTRLEDALVPVYNYHRYQLEAVCKLIGGMDYAYNTRGDRQTTPHILDATIQKRAITAALDCLDPAVLALPESVLRLVPPRAPEYYDIGELMPKRSGMNLDPLAAAEALTQYELVFLLNASRANRMVAFKARANTPGFDDLTDSLLRRIWLRPVPGGLAGQIQLQTQQILVTHLLALSQQEMANYAVKAICFRRLQEIKQRCQMLIKQNAPHRAFYEFAVERIEKPKDIALPTHRELPPGAPIGCED